MGRIINNFKIMYFSGTGCTALAAGCLEKALRERGREAGVERIAAGKDGSFTHANADAHASAHADAAHAADAHAHADALILLFPVYACTAPGPVMEWLRGIGMADGTQTAVISVSGGGEISPNTACRVSAVKALCKKGYDVFYEDSIVMPSNIAVATPEPAAVRLLQVLPDRIGASADGILSGAKKRMAPLFIDRLFARIGKAIWRYAKSWGSATGVSDECDGCGLCAAQCSTGNISMAGPRPEFGGNCCMCLGCFYACPKGALTPKRAKSLIVKGFNLKELEEKAAASGRAGAAPPPAGYMWHGVKKYLNSAEL